MRNAGLVAESSPQPYSFDYLNLPEIKISPTIVTAFDTANRHATLPADVLPVHIISLTPDNRKAGGGGSGRRGGGRHGRGGGGGGGDGGIGKPGESPSFRGVTPVEVIVFVPSTVLGGYVGSRLYADSRVAEQNTTKALETRINDLDAQVKELQLTADRLQEHQESSTEHNEAHSASIRQSINHKVTEVNALWAQMPTQTGDGLYLAGGIIGLPLMLAMMASGIRYSIFRKRHPGTK